jgi:hypothetical protein
MPLYFRLNLMMLAFYLQNVSCAYWSFPGDNWAQVGRYQLIIMTKKQNI